MKWSPLNIVTAFFLVSSGYLLAFPDEAGWRRLGAIPLLVLAVLAFIVDVLFKTYIKDIKRIWIVELAFIIFAAVLTILLGKV